MQASLLVRDGGRDRLGVVGTTGVVGQAALREHIGDPAERLLLAERQLEGGEPRPE